MKRSLTQVSRYAKPLLNVSVRKQSTAAAAAPQMFCYQCEQTESQKGCSTVGVCGKDAPTAALQDLQLHFNIGIAQWANAIRNKGGEVSEATKELLLDSTFATLTNVNFDSDRFLAYLKQANSIRNSLVKQANSLGIDSKSLTGPAQFKYDESKDFLMMEAKAQGVLARKAKMHDDNALVVREMAQYGIKGT
jgi:hydroxylamine reductase